MHRVWKIAVCLFASLVLMVVGMHVYAQVFRWRAERLLSELKTLRVEETPAATVLKLRSKYSSIVDDGHPCSEEHCAFSIDLHEWESLIREEPLSHSWSERPRYYLVSKLRFLALRLNFFSTKLQVENGKLSGISVGFLQMSYVDQLGYVEHAFPSSFSVTVRTVGNFRNRVGWPKAYLLQVYEHPNLFVWEDTCKGCSPAINVDLTPQASREEFERALGFDLSCMTRFHGCRTSEEFFPAAAQMLKHDPAKQVENSGRNVVCDSRMTRILGRDRDVVGVVRIKKVSADDAAFAITDYDWLKLLKGKAMNLKEVHYLQSAGGIEEAHSSHLSERFVQVGGEQIVFLNEVFGHPLLESSCAIIAATPQNLSAALEGIADDRSDILGHE